MSPLPAFLRQLHDDEAGAMFVETAIIAPVLLLLSLGAFQVSDLVARQNELQSAMSVAQSIALASDPDTSAKRSTLQQIIVASTGLATGQVTVAEAYRCNASTRYVALKTDCLLGDKISSYVKIQIRDTYTPMWTNYGVGKPYNFDLVRYVQYRQGTNT